MAVEYVGIICITASVTALLLCIIVLCRSRNNDPTARKCVRTLGFLHMFLPNIMLFVAFVCCGLLKDSNDDDVYPWGPNRDLEDSNHDDVYPWGPNRDLEDSNHDDYFNPRRPDREAYIPSSESLYDTVFCCALCILRPLMLIYVSPYLKMSGAAVVSEFVIFTIVYYSVLYRDYDIPDFVFGLTIFLCAIITISILTKMKNPFHRETCKWIWDKVTDVAVFSYFILPSLQITVVVFTAELERQVSPIIMLVPVFCFLSFSCLRGLNKEKNCPNLLSKISWIIFMTVMTAAVVFLCTVLLHRDWRGWLCVLIFQKVLWMSAIYIDVNKDLDLNITLKKILYVFGSVVVVLLNSVAAIMKTNYHGSDWDMRIIVFSSESFFTFSLLFLLIFGPWISDMKCLQCCQNQDSQNAAPAPANQATQETEETYEIKHLLRTRDQKAGRSDVAEETQPDSVEIQV